MAIEIHPNLKVSKTTKQKTKQKPKGLADPNLEEPIKPWKNEVGTPILERTEIDFVKK